MYGSIIVTDPAQDSLQGGVLPSAADTRTLVLSDLTVCKTPGSNDTVNFDPTLAACERRRAAGPGRSDAERPV